jgi:putative NADH-flavin reductase
MIFLSLFVCYAVALSLGLAFAGYRSRPAASGEKPGRNSKRILIVGATGGTGRQLVVQALERGYTVTALVRAPSRLQVEHPNLNVIRGDVVDLPSVDAAMSGQDAVLCALGHRRYFSPARILSEGTRNILRSMETHGVSRPVCETSLGIGGSAGRMGLYYTFFTIPLILPLYFWDKTRQERLIAASHVEWVIVRPASLTNRERRGHTRHGFRVGSFFLTRFVPRADVAEFMLDQLQSNRYLRSATGVC